MDIRDHDIEKLKRLNSGDECTLMWCDGGGAMVHKAQDVYVLFEVPQYGGQQRFEEVYIEGDEGRLLDLVYTWT